jgi:branched-subunit amino acid aminotransferase/4-amino-4-deoxychorismate lyase
VSQRHSIITTAKETGGNVEEAAKIAAGGAIEASGTVGTSASGIMLVGVVKGIKEVASATLPKGKAATLHRNDAQRPR